MNLKQLSDILGISQTTISRALNGYPEVSKTTREKVEAAAKQYGYAPSSVARRLAGKRVEAVGVIYPFDRSLRTSPVFLEMVRNLSQCLREEKVDLFIIPGDAREELALYERMVTGGRVDAFVVVATRRDDSRITWLQERSIPFVAHGRSQVAGDYSWYDVDNRGGIKKAAEALAELGHRRIALLAPDESFNYACERRDGFREAVEAQGLSLEQCLIYTAGLDEEAGAAFIESVNALSVSERPTAIICSSILNARGVIEAGKNLGLMAGEDFSIIAWDDGLSDIDIPEMSVVDAPVGPSGERMASLMMKLLRNDDGAPFQELQEVELHLRSSVKPLLDQHPKPSTT